MSNTDLLIYVNSREGGKKSQTKSLRIMQTTLGMGSLGVLSKGLKTEATCRSGAHRVPLRNPIAAQVVKSTCRGRFLGLAGVKQTLPHHIPARDGGKSKAKLRRTVSW